MFLKLKRTFGLRIKPDRRSDTIVLINPEILLEPLGTENQKKWTKVRARVPVGDWPTGFLPTDALDNAGPITPPPADIDEKRFVDSCTLASRVANARSLFKRLTTTEAESARGNETGTGNENVIGDELGMGDERTMADGRRLSEIPIGVHRDLLIAWAWMESGIRNEGSVDTGAMTSGALNAGAFGPFQFTGQAWTDFLDNQGGRQRGFNEGHYLEPYAQCYAAAQSILEATAFLSEQLTPDPEPADGPYIPESSEIFLAHLVGREAAAKVLATSNTQTTIDVPLEEALGNKASKLIEANSEILVDSGAPASIKLVRDRIGNSLQDGLKKAAELVAKHRPEEEPVKQTEQSSKPPWMAVAETEVAKNIREHGSPPNAEITKYFEETTLGRVTSELPWCAAFVSYCMAKSSSEKIRKSSLRSARAADWMAWGTHVPNPRHGALAVLHPLVRGASGHVGFVTDLDATHVSLLGGNQGNALKVSKFPVSKVRSYRWQNWQDQALPPPPPTPPVPGPSGVGIRPLLDLIGKVESSNNYNAYFGKANNKTKPEFTSMTIDKVLAWQDDFVARGSRSSAVGRYQIIRKTLRGLKKELDLSGSTKFDQAMQDKLAIQLLNRRKLQSFRSGAISAEAFANNLAKEWASLPLVTGPKKGRSYYAGDGLNKALVSVSEILTAVNSIRA